MVHKFLDEWLCRCRLSRQSRGPVAPKNIADLKRTCATTMASAGATGNTGIDADTLAKKARSDLADSALHAPQAGLGDTEFYPEVFDKAAVLVCRLAWNHPLPDGNTESGSKATTMPLGVKTTGAHADSAVRPYPFSSFLSGRIVLGLRTGMLALFSDLLS